MTTAFYEAIQGRRSIFGLSKTSPISDERLQEVIELAVKNAPSAFNSQTGRIVVLLNDQHETFWQLALKNALAHATLERIESTTARFQGFAEGYGTVLFFEDYEVIDSYQEKFPKLKDQFPIWSHQGAGMLQYVIWTALEHEGYGASLQHYYPELSEELRTAWHIKASWQLIAQLPFGGPTAAPRDKEIVPVVKRVFIIK
ncbi:nitroreductase family protein [Lysinibacillus parviboronicapiens]|uniref:nitroreductase family protein n=1 Tax=Lysinibacillus parviboronicapiens TaxID=436516 RepID=UPI000D3818AB|nr:nitroreductase family protein [Lysinibacillus parviboronicapiens]